MLEVWKENRDEAAISAEEALSEVLAEQAEKAKDLRRRRMAAVGPYVMPESGGVKAEKSAKCPVSLRLKGACISVLLCKAGSG